MSSVPPGGSSSRSQIPGSRKNSPERPSTSVLAEASKTRRGNAGTSSSDTDSSQDHFERVEVPRKKGKTPLVERNRGLRSFPGFGLANSDTEESSDEGYVPLKEKKRRGVEEGFEDISRAEFQGLSGNESSSDSGPSNAPEFRRKKKFSPEDKVEFQRREIESGVNTGSLLRDRSKKPNLLVVTPFASLAPLPSNRQRNVDNWEVLPAARSNYYDNADAIPKYGYATCMELVDALIKTIKTRSTNSLSKQEPGKAIERTTTTLNNSLVSLPQMKANTLEILKRMQWGTLGGAVLSIGQSEGGGMATQKGLELGYTNLVRMLSGNDSISAKQMFADIEAILINPELMWFPADDPRRKHVQELVAKGKATTTQISKEGNVSKSDEDVWDQLREIYSRIFTTLYPQHTLSAPKPFTSSTEELSDRRISLTKELKSNLLSEWHPDDVQSLMKAYLSGRLPEDYSDLKPITIRRENSKDTKVIDFKSLFQKQVGLKSGYETISKKEPSSLDALGIFEGMGYQKQKEMNTQIERTCFNRVMHQLSLELGANRQVNQAEKSLSKGLLKGTAFQQGEDTPALKALINLYVNGAPLSEKEQNPQVSTNPNPEQKAIEQAAFDKLIALYHGSKVTDFSGFALHSEMERQLGAVRQKALDYQKKVKQIDELVNSYPEKHRPFLRSAAINCLNGEPLRIILNGVSGTGKSHFIEEVSRITGRPKVLVLLTQGKTGGTKADDLMKPASTDSSPLKALDKRLDEIVGHLAEILLHAPKNVIIYFDEGFGALINDSQLLSLGNTLLNADSTEYKTAIGIVLKLQEIGYALTGNVNMSKKLRGSNFFETPDKDVIKSVLGRFAPFFIQFDDLHQPTIDAKIDKKFDDLNEKRKNLPYHEEVMKECEDFYKKVLKEAISDSSDAQSLGMRVATRPFVDILLDHLHAFKQANPTTQLSDESVRQQMKDFIQKDLLTVVGDAFSNFTDRFQEPFRKANTMYYQVTGRKLNEFKDNRLGNAKGLGQQKTVERMTEVIKEVVDELYFPLMGIMQSMFMTGVEFKPKDFLDSGDCETIYTELYDQFAPQVSELNDEMNKLRPGSEEHIRLQDKKDKLYEEIQKMISTNGIKFLLRRSGIEPDDTNLKEQIKKLKPSISDAINKIKTGNEFENFDAQAFLASPEFEAVIVKLNEAQSQFHKLEKMLEDTTSDHTEGVKLLATKQKHLQQEEFNNLMVAAAHKFVQKAKV